MENSTSQVNSLILLAVCEAFHYSNCNEGICTPNHPSSHIPAKESKDRAIESLYCKCRMVLYRDIEQRELMNLTKESLTLKAPSPDR